MIFFKRRKNISKIKTIKKINEISNEIMKLKISKYNQLSKKSIVLNLFKYIYYENGKWSVSINKMFLGFIIKYDKYFTLFTKTQIATTTNKYELPLLELIKSKNWNKYQKEISWSNDINLNKLNNLELYVPIYKNKYGSKSINNLLSFLF